MTNTAITGTGSGIGAAVRKHLEAQGHQVIGVDLKNAEIRADLSKPEGRGFAIEGIVAACDGANALIMAAAVADFQPAEPVGEKIKRQGRESLSLQLAPTPDILAEVGRPPGLVKVGFAAESQDLVANAKAKIESKGLDLIVANDITATDAGFSVDTNRVLVIDSDGEQEEWPLMTKYEVAWRILDRVQKLIEA